MKKTTTELNRRDQVEHPIATPFKFVEDEMKIDGWQRGHLAKAYDWKMPKNLLFIDPVLQVLKLKLIDEFKVWYRPHQAQRICWRESTGSCNCCMKLDAWRRCLM